MDTVFSTILLSSQGHFKVVLYRQDDEGRSITHEMMEQELGLVRFNDYMYIVGNIGNIRIECIGFLFHGKWIVVWNKQIAQEPLCGSLDLFEPRYDSFPMNQDKKHSFLK